MTSTHQTIAAQVDDLQAGISGPGPVDVAIFGLTFALVGLAACLLYATAFSASRRLVRRPRATNALMRGSGGILTAFALGPALEGVRGS